MRSVTVPKHGRLPQDVLVPASEASEFREAWLQEAAEPYQEWMSPWGVQLDLATTIAFAVQSFLGLLI